MNDETFCSTDHHDDAAPESPPGAGPARIEGVPTFGPGRELAALQGGPWGNAWYWRDELETQQNIAREAATRCAQVAVGWKAFYRPTEDWTPNPDPDPKLRGVPGRVWRWQPEQVES